MSDVPLDEVQRQISESIKATDSLVRVVLSGRRRNFQPPYERIDIRPVEIKGKVALQLSMFDGRQMTTKNYAADKFSFEEYFSSGYANFTVENTYETLSIRISKKGEPLISRSKANREQELAHDKKKERLLNPTDPFLFHVGIADREGKIKPSKMDKYKQVEEFLRLLVPAVNEAISAGHIKQPTTESPLTIVDLGCGHAYLTFAAHQYFAAQGFPIRVTGIDIRESSRVRNHQIAVDLGIEESMSFRAEEIASTPIAIADVAIALHACDTATDDAIAWAIARKVSLALFAPCCHHDIQAQMKVAPEPWSIITRHGIMRERLGDLITDALRMQMMKMHGYRVEAVEFIGGEHTPRNLMIRAVNTGAVVDEIERSRYQQMIDEWGVTPVLATILNR